MKHFYVYCVYELLEDGTELPVYIGKGHDDSDSGYSRLSHYREEGLPRATRTVQEALSGKKCLVKKLADADDEIHAYALERRFVAEYGRRFLVNCTDGGCAGWTLSAESRKKMSDARRGKKLGPASEEHRLKLSAAARRRAADPVWRAAHSARLQGRRPAAAAVASAKLALTGKPHPNRAAKKAATDKLIAQQRAVLEPFAGQNKSVAYIFGQVKDTLKLEHVSALYRAIARTGLNLKTASDLSGLSAAEKRQRRLETYKKSYLRHRSERILKATVRAKISKTAKPKLQVRTAIAATVCHQRTIRDQTKSEDIARLTPSLGDLTALKASDFDLTVEPYSSCHRDFIKRYEWLGTTGSSIKWCFTARYRGELAGVVLLSEPYYPSKTDALIARGACAGWTPKNLGSRLVMHACSQMPKITEKRCFVAYADEEAGEVGQIYQACNFKFLGWKVAHYGMKPDGSRVSLQTFKRTSRMLPWLTSKGIALTPDCFTTNGYLRWSAIPEEVKKLMREHIEHQKQDVQKVKLRRGKYILLRGIGPAETRKLNADFKQLVFPYPKRGGTPGEDLRVREGGVSEPRVVIS